MYRLAYRNFGDHEALVVNHSVTAGSSVGVRWYEIRSPGGTPTVFQQGTYAPDAGYRWMGSIAMDRAGDIGLGYSISSSTTHPGIRYTGRLVTDALNTLQAEASIIDGAGSQTGGLSRWGDYSSITVDPWTIARSGTPTNTFRRTDRSTGARALPLSSLPPAARRTTRWRLRLPATASCRAPAPATQ